MAENRGKQFESVIRESFEKVSGVSIDRLYDNQSGYLNIATISDFIVYKEPYEYYIECKSVHGTTFSINSNDPKKKYGLITNKQWEGMLEKSKIQGVFAGVIVWWVDKDVTKFIPIQTLTAAWRQSAETIPRRTATRPCSPAPRPTVRNIRLSRLRSP